MAERKIKKRRNCERAQEVEPDQAVSKKLRGASLAAAEDRIISQENKGRKRKRKAKLDEGLSPEEQQRRQKQRELQDLALSMRREGKPYKRPPAKKRKTDKAAVGTSNGNTGQSMEKEETGSRPSSPVQVIVIPIFWNRKPEEKEEVIAAAQKIVELLQSGGLTSGIDTTNAMSPGQKFKYWEDQGVKVRVECGPSDVNKRSCVLAVNKKAGELAEKQSLQVGSKLVSQAASALGMQIHQETTVPEIPVSRATPEVSRKRAPLSSGDDLGGDFEGLDVEDLSTEGQKKKTKKRTRLH